jgi:hypothetical protein
MGWTTEELEFDPLLHSVQIGPGAHPPLSQGVKSTTSLHLVWTFRMHAVIPPTQLHCMVPMYGQIAIINFTRMFGIPLRIYYDVKGTVNASSVSINKQLISNCQSIYLKIQQTLHVSVL